MECNKVKARPCKVPSGNDFQLYIRVEKPNYETGETIWEPFDLSVCKNITVQLLNEPRNIYIPLEWALDDEDNSKIIANVEGLSLTPGSSYGMQITGIDSDGNNFRWKARGREMFSAVDATNDANLNEDLMDYLDVKVRIGFEYASEIFATKEELNAVSGQVETNTQNIESNTTAIAQNYATLTQSINDEARTRSTNDQALQSAITTVDDKFEMYYPKADVYNKTEIDNEVSAINGSIGSEESSRIAGDDNLQTQINTKANKSDVYNKTSVNSLLADKADKSTTYTKTEVYNKTEVYTKTETYNKDEVDELIEEAGGGGYTDTILVGQGLINNNDEGFPTAVFGRYNSGTQGELFTVGNGGISEDIHDYLSEYWLHFNPLQEWATTFTYSYEHQDLKTNIANCYYHIDNGPRIRNIDTQEESYMAEPVSDYFKIEFDENDEFTFTSTCKDGNGNDLTYTLSMKYHDDTSILDMTFECPGYELYIDDGNGFRITEHEFIKKDSLLVKSDGKTYISETGTSTTTYALQDKFNDIDDSLSEVQTLINNSSSFEIEDNYEYNSYLYHPASETYVLKETEDLTPYESEYFTIEAIEAATSYPILQINGTNYTLYWSTDKTTWTDAVANGITGTFPAGTKIYLKGTMEQSSLDEIGVQYKFAIDTVTAISGNIHSLIFSDNFANTTDISSYAQVFQCMFDHCHGLKDASRLILPATTLSDQCYSSMFYDCDILEAGPRELPATTLTYHCYNEMFWACTSLVKTVAVLPAEELPHECYRLMYADCPTLTKFPSIRALRPASGAQYCLWGMGTGSPNVKYAEIMLTDRIFEDNAIDYHWINPQNVTNGTLVLNTANDWAGTYPITDNYGIPEGWTVVYVDPANPEETNPTIIYDKSETYNKEEVDELIESAGGTTYTDTILVGQGLITDDLLPTAKFGLINKEKSAVFSVGKGSINEQYTDINALTPLNEKAHIFTQTISSNLETTWTNGDQMAYFNFRSFTNGYDSSDIEFTINKNYMTIYIEPIFKDHILTKTLKYREENYPDRNFDINITLVVDPNNNTTEVTITTTHDIKFTTSPTITRGSVNRCDALRVMPDGKTYINVTRSDNYICLQDKFSNIDLNINSINNTVSSLPTPEILSQTEYDNYLYHDPNKMYVTTEEDLTDYKNEYFTITPLSYGSPMGSFRLSIDASNFSIEYSKDKITWTSYTSESWYGFTDLEPVYLRGTGSAYSSSTKFGQFSFILQNVKISGNIMSLLYGDNFQNQTSLTEYNIEFSQLFLGQTAIIDASKLILPATSLSNSAYSQMFMNCSNLTYGPKELPATTLTQYCYSAMFESCSKLAQPISLLPSTNGASYCYKGMYKNCISLAKSPSIRLTNGQMDFLSLHLTDEMFYGCISLKYVEIMANHTSANWGLGSNFLYNVPNDPNSICVMNGNSGYLGDIPNNWQVVKVTPPTNS